MMIVDGVEKYHRNMDRAFKTDEEARLWVEKQSAE